jgi:hypothetical protein
MSEDELARQRLLTYGRRPFESNVPLSGDVTSEFTRIIEPSPTPPSATATQMERFVESRGLKLDEMRELALRESIVSRLASYLDQNYDDQVVAITYDGKIVASAKSDFELIGKIEALTIPSSQIFMHRVGRPPEGWT